MRIAFLAALVVTAIAVPGSAARGVSSGPILTYSVFYSPDARAGVNTDGGVCATGPNGHSFRITDPYRDLAPAWGPDGKHIAFTRYLERVPEGAPGNISDVYVADAMGDHVRNLSARIGGNLNIGSSWSPDGRQLAFAGGWYGDGLFVVNLDGTGVREIAWAPYNSSLGGPAWSPDGRRILFTRAPQGQHVSVYAIDPDGSDEAKLVDSAAAAVWSPDGGKIAYLAVTGQQTAVVIADADGSNPRALTGYGSYGDPAWAPDGQWIAFEEGGRLMLIRPDGSGEHAADTDGLPAAMPAWLPGGNLPAHRRPCVITGTRHADAIRGTTRGDLIDGRGGDDRIYGLGGDDTIIGGSGHDSLFGGAGRDLFGATDHYRDLLSGGRGTDAAYFNKHDRLKSIELSAATDAKP